VARSSRLMADASGLHGLRSAPGPSFMSRFQGPDTLHRCNEHISSSAYGHDEALEFRAQCVSEIADLDANVGVLHGQVRPHMFQDLPRADNITAAFHQEHEYVEGAAAKLDLILAGEQQTSARNQAIGPELENLDFDDPLLQERPQYFIPARH